MTTIVFDGTYIASDSQITLYDQKAIYARHKFEIIRGRIYAMSGSGPLMTWFAKWYEAGCPQGDKVPPGDWTLVVIDKDTTMYLMTKGEPYPEQVNPPFAIGSGARHAQGAVLMHASAIEATCIACKIDTYSTGPVYSLNIKEALSGKKKGSRIPTEWDVDSVLAQVKEMRA